MTDTIIIIVGFGLLLQLLSLKSKIESLMDKVEQIKTALDAQTELITEIGTDIEALKAKGGATPAELDEILAKVRANNESLGVLDQPDEPQGPGPVEPTPEPTPEV